MCLHDRFAFADGADGDGPPSERGPLTWDELLAGPLARNQWLRFYPKPVHPAVVDRVRAAIEAAPYPVNHLWREAVAVRKTYRLLGADGRTCESPTPGLLGGNGKDMIYGKLTCGSAVSAIRRWGDAYARHRVFFADEATAKAAGFRPCGNCMRAEYAEWTKAREAAGGAG